MNEDQRKKKIFPEWLRETFLFPSTHNILARGKEQGSDTNSKTWTDSLNYVWEVSKNRDLVAYHSNLISPLDFYRPPFTSYSIAKSMASLQKGGLKCKYSCRKHIDFEDFRRAFLHFLNNPGLQKGDLKVYSHFSLWLLDAFRLEIGWVLGIEKIDMSRDLK